MSLAFWTGRREIERGGLPTAGRRNDEEEMAAAAAAAVLEEEAMWVSTRGVERYVSVAARG
jgi:hypothetical protein